MIILCVTGSIAATESIKLARELRRNGAEGAKMFESRWIPLEEKYFSVCAVKGQCDCTIDTSKM